MSRFLPNAGQERAIEAHLDVPTRVMAGAGTGKTEVISRRFVHLLQEEALRPDQILVLTFSEHGAAEMRARIFRAVAEAGLGFGRLDLAGTWISTFNSFGARLLKEYGLLAGIDPDTPLATEIDLLELERGAMERFLEAGFREAYSNPEDPFAGDYPWEDGGPLALASDLIGQLRNQAVWPEGFLEEIETSAQSHGAYRALAPLVGWLYRESLAELVRRGQLDYDRQIMGAVALLERQPGVRAWAQDLFQAILVDEYQDTNYAQERLLDALSAGNRANVTVVGDPRQAIYGWREARVENIAHFSVKSRGVFEAPLTENYRSRPPILKVANRAIEGYQFGDPPEFEAGKVLTPGDEHADFEGAVVSLQAAPGREAEAWAVTDWIRRLRAQGLAYRDIVILIRARTYLQAYLEALEAAGIPFELSAGDAFYSRPEVLDAVHLLATCLDPSDDLSLARTLLSPAVGLTQAEVANLAQARRRGDRLWATLLDPSRVRLSGEVRERLGRLMALWEATRVLRWARSPPQLFAHLLRQGALETTAMVRGDATGVRAIRKLQAILHDTELQHPGASVEEHLRDLRLLLESDFPEKAPELAGETDAVRVMTAHASKGLEFPAVIGVDNRQKVRPRRGLGPFHEPEVGLVFPREDETNPHFQTRVRRAMNEARCLWYVTLTRAQERLILTAPNGERLDEKGGFESPQTFFEELWNRQVEDPLRGVELHREIPAGALEPGAPREARAPEPSLADVRGLRAGLAPKLVPGKPELRITPTDFQRYRRCPASYRYHRPMEMGRLEEGDRAYEAELGSGLALGAAFHRAVAAHAQLPEASADDLLKAAELEGSGLGEDHRLQLRAWLGSYLESELGQDPPAAGSVERSLLVRLELGPAQLAIEGKADRLEPDLLVDFKTEAEVQGLAEKYADQVRLYALAGRRAGLLGEQATLVLYHAPTARLIPMPFSKSEEAELLGTLEEFCARAGSEDASFETVPGEWCRWCGAASRICREGSEWLMDGEDPSGEH